MTDAELMHYNSLGLIPGPTETMDDFAARVEFCLSLKPDLNALKDTALGQALPQDASLPTMDAENTILQEAFKSTRENFGIAPDFVPLFFSNWRLAPWHGAAAWIFQMDLPAQAPDELQKSPLGALVQMRKRLYLHQTYFFGYQRDELLAHELAHVGRMAFNEPKFEEVFAYQGARHLLSRTLGPIVQSSLESRWFVILLAAIILLDLFFAIQGSWAGYQSIFYLKALPLALIGLAAFRLTRYRRALKTVSSKLSCLLKSKQSAAPLLYRLTDKEILTFAKQSAEEIKAYALKEPSLRWHVIRLAYL